MSPDDRPEDQSGTPLDISKAPYRREDFAAVLEQTFALQPGNGKSIPLKLVALENSTINNPGLDSFSLYFSPPVGEPPLPDNSYVLENPVLGKITMHLSATPVNSGDPRDHEYEAVFVLRNT